MRWLAPAWQHTTSHRPRDAAVPKGQDARVRGCQRHGRQPAARAATSSERTWRWGAGRGRSSRPPIDTAGRCPTGVRRLATHARRGSPSTRSRQLERVASELPTSLAIHGDGASRWRGNAPTSRRKSAGRGFGMVSIASRDPKSSHTRSTPTPHRTLRVSRVAIDGSPRAAVPRRRSRRGRRSRGPHTGSSRWIAR